MSNLIGQDLDVIKIGQIVLVPIDRQSSKAQLFQTGFSPPKSDKIGKIR